MDKALLPLTRYFDFRGRSTRTEYWAYSIALGLVYACLVVLTLATATPREGPTGLGVLAIVLMFVVAIGTAVPSIAVTVRRLHDQDRSGWMTLFCFVPYVGSVVLLVLMCLGGTKGPNRFGEDPRTAGTHSDIH
jgi:uncharacterized membrane protein YhaH (DUF805 family)